MKLKLSKPLVIFDLESTGTNPAKDKIVQIAILKVFPDDKKITYERIVNPGIPIPEKTSKIHGITDDMVADKPSFKDIAHEVAEFIKGCDIAGYNALKFDLPLLAEEFVNAGIEFDFSKPRIIDVQVIFYKKEPRTLSAAYKFYCGKDLENAHNAMSDVEATYEVLLGQLERYEDLQGDVQFLSDYTTRGKNADMAGFIGYNDKGEEIFNFGKYKGKKVSEIFQTDTGYYGWLQKADFPQYTKKVLSKIMTKIKLNKNFKVK
jgi:DNA polymerase-3 subunit epsilon